MAEKSAVKYGDAKNIPEQIIKEKLPKNIKIGKGNTEPDITSSYDGQVDGFFPAYDTKTGKKIGYVDFTDYDGEVTIRMISVDDAYRGKNIGTSLVAAVEKEFPKSKLKWSFMTKEGEALKGKYEKIKKEFSS